MGATAGDLLARDVVCGWLEDVGCPYEVAVAPPFSGGVNWENAAPGDYTHLIFVCGPFGNGWPITDLLARFEGCRLVGVDLSMLEPLEVWNPFDLLLERDSSRTARPDVSFLSLHQPMPVVGVVLVHRQKEYEGGLHEIADAAVSRLVRSRDAAVVAVDTRLDVNAAGLHSAAQVEALIARTDVVVTTRLHGMVLALKNAVPVVAIDPIAGGAKIKRQAEVIGWPYVVTADTLDDAVLDRMLDACLQPRARELAIGCRDKAVHDLDQVRAAVTNEFRSTD